VVGNWKRLEDFSRTESQNLDVRRRLGIPAGALLVVCITQLLKDRKIDELLQAVDQCPDVHLIVGGRGVLRSFVEEAAIANPRIHFVGFVSADQIAEYTCAADVVYYGFDPDNPNAKYSAPNKLFEALSAGRPLVTGDFGEIGEVVRETQCGIVLSRYGVDEICAAFHKLSDSGVRQVMASSASQFGRMVTNWQNAEKTLYREYSALLPEGILRRPESSEPTLQNVQHRDCGDSQNKIGDQWRSESCT
jgi:glycosyltransferase involved in cell wall biosynthesis